MLKKFTALKKAFGIKVTCYYSLHWILKKLHTDFGFHYYYFYKQPIDNTSLPVKPGKNDYVWLSQYDDLLIHLPRPKHVILERFKHGCKCIMVLKDGVFCGCIWFAYSKYREDEVRCDYIFGDTNVWDFDVYIIPQYRIGRLFLQLWAKASKDLKKQGYQYSLSRISAYNQNSISSHEKLGATKVSEATYLCLGKVQICIANTAPYIHIGLNHNSRHSMAL